MKKILLACLIIFSVSLSAESNTSSKSALISKKTQSLLNKISKAHKLDNFNKLHSMKQVATVKMPQAAMSMTLEHSSKKDKVLMKMDIATQGQKMTQRMAFDGNKAWSKDMMSGLRELSGAEHNTILKNSLTNIIAPEKFYDEIILHNTKETFSEIECYKIEYKKKDLKGRLVYINPKTYMIVGEVNIETGPMGEQKSTIIYTSYKKHEEGFLYPKTFTLQTGPMLMKGTVKTFETNLMLDDSIFAMPKN